MSISKSHEIVTLFVISTLFLSEYFSLNLLNVIEPFILNEFDCTHTDAGWLGSVYFYTMVIFLIPAGYIIDKYDVRKILILSALGGALGTFCLSLSNNYVHLILSRIMVGGFLGAFALNSCIKFISKFFIANKLSSSINILLFTGIFGGVLSQERFGALVTTLGWRKALTIIGGIGIGISVLLMITVSQYKDTEKQSIPSKKNGSFFKLFISFIRKPGIGINFRLGTMTSILNLPLFVLGSLFGITFLRECYGLSTVDAANVTTYLFWGMLSGCILFFILTQLDFKENNLLVTGHIIVLLALILLLFPQRDMFILKIIFYLIGIGAGSSTLSYSLIVKLNQHHVGIAEGLHSTLIFLGGALIQPIFGKILDLSHFLISHQNSTLSFNSNISFYFGFMLLICLMLFGLYCAKPLTMSIPYPLKMKIEYPE